MDNCTKLKLFNILLLLCAINLLMYKWFSGPTSLSMSIVSSVQRKENTGSTKMAVGEKTDSHISVFDPAFKGSLALNSNKEFSNGALMNESPKTDSVDQKAEENKEHDIDVFKEEKYTQQGGQQTAIVNSGHNTGGAFTTVGSSVQSDSKSDLPDCPSDPPNLIGPLATYKEPLTFEETGSQNPGLRLGGRYAPTECKALHRVAIVIPYRNREEHLKILMRNLHPMLMRQQLDYGIYVVDQALPGRFNRAMLMNIGYAEALKRHDYQCAIFHDVDLVPENDRNIYSCPTQPRHMSASIDKFKYRLPYATIFGGVSGISKEQMEKINGFSNKFFGWGGEDDDMATRLKLKGYKIQRYPMEIARYKMISHKREQHNEANPKRFELLRTTGSRQDTDGLNSLKYEVQQVEELPTHTRLQVLIKESEIMA